jgi:dihydroorotase
LQQQEWNLPATIHYGSDELVPLAAGQLVRWRCIPADA